MIRLDSHLLAQYTQGWDAGLRVELVRRQGCTRLVHSRHWGPLRVQRPFYPSDSGECHLYLLHPPGGMVTGDRLAITVNLAEAAHALLTTPSAGKIYRGNDSAVAQIQTVDCQVSGDSYLEWLPQETIVFNGARGEIATRVNLDEGARCAVWDIVCLGRPASGETFDAGYMNQSLEITRAGRPLYRERNHFEGGSDLLSAPWGLHGCPVAGSFLLTVATEREQISALREQLNSLAGSSAAKELIGVSDLGGLVAIRYIGHSTERCRAVFTAAWRILRPPVCGLDAVEPRIWRT